MNAQMCDQCKEQPMAKMVMVAVRTQTSDDGKLSASRMEFRAIPMCLECMKARKQSARANDLAAMR